MSQSSRNGFLFVVVFVNLIFSASGTPGQAQPRAVTTVSDLSSSIEATASMVGPAVVEIFTTAYAPGEGVIPHTADLVTTQRASGSGVIVGSDGYIVTNAHVVRGAQRLRVEIPMPTSGFAAPSNIVRTVYEQIRNTGRVRRGDIGIRAQTLTPVLASGLNLARNYGAVLADVMPGSPAARAGLRPGDLVLGLDGKPMENGRQLHVNLYRRFVGDVVALEILRDNQILKVSVTMMERRDPLADLSASIDPRQNLVPRLGILGLNLDQRIAELLPVLRGQAGVVVAATVAGAIDSREGGLAPGDVVYAVNRKPVVGLAELRAVLDGLTTGDPVVLQLERRGELMYLAFTVE